MAYLTHAPGWLRTLMPPGLVWRGPQCNAEGKPAVYLTFDDGPHPSITPFVLDLLREHSAQATFFCVGEQAARHADVCERALREGHTLGNHTHHHLSGWKTDLGPYLADVATCAQALPATTLFRPPYGRINRAQAAALQSGDQPMRIVMWDVLSADFDAARTGAFCRDTVLRLVRPGSIVVFHDSEKAWPRLKEALPEVVAALLARGFALEALPATAEL